MGKKLKEELKQIITCRENDVISLKLQNEALYIRAKDAEKALEESQATNRTLIKMIKSGEV